MSTILHFIDVGQGNMTLIQLDDGSIFLYDCNITEENEEAVLDYLEEQIGLGTKIDVFICSHRDSDHMRGIKKIHAKFPVKIFWDSGVPGTITSGDEYRNYMDLRRKVGFEDVKKRTKYIYGNTKLRIMNSKNDNLTDNPNAQSIVIKVIHRDSSSDKDYDSVMLTGDTDAATWKTIQEDYRDTDLSCSLLLASHHGSLTYFDDPSNKNYYYIDHIKAKSPEMTIISVGENGYGHPDDKVLKYYEKYSTGSKNGSKIVRTDIDGNIRVVLKDRGGWSLYRNQ